MQLRMNGLEGIVKLGFESLTSLLNPSSSTIDIGPCFYFPPSGRRRGGGVMGYMDFEKKVQIPLCRHRLR